jgi:hypothetical protein
MAWQGDPNRKEEEMARYARQHGRKAFGPGRKSSKQAVATDIARSIAGFAARGIVREVAQYTNNGETQQLVRTLLAQAA